MSTAKLSSTVQVNTLPGTDRFIVQTQYTEGGSLFTNSNDQRGYTEDEAHALADSIRADLHKNRFNAPR